MKALYLLALAAGSARADPWEVSAGPLVRSSNAYVEWGGRLSVGWSRDDGVHGWRFDVQYAKYPEPGRTNSTSLRGGYVAGSRVAPWLVLGTQIAFGVDEDSFPDGCGYTDSSVHAVAGTELRATIALGRYAFIATSIDGNVRPFHVGNNHSDDLLTFDAGIWVGVR